MLHRMKIIQPISLAFIRCLFTNQPVKYWEVVFVDFVAVFRETKLIARKIIGLYIQ
jgi:hypothetical protein